MNGVLFRSSMAACGAAIVCIVILGGCSKEEPGAIVRGKVTYKSQPLDQGTITFQPNGSGQFAYGAVQKDGTFELLNQRKTNRIAPGKYIAVLVTGTDQIAAVKDDPMWPVQPVVPFKFNNVNTSPLKYDIVLGENNLDVNLDKYPPK